MSLFMGIDPGLTGAIALYDPANPKDIKVFDMPTFAYRNRAGQLRRFLDGYAIARWLDLHSAEVTKATIEEVNAFPGQGVRSVFTFGVAYGMAQGLLMGQQVTLQYVRPNVWKKRLGLASEQKEASRRRIIEMFPQHAKAFERVKDDGRAEALLLAIYGSRYEQ